MSSTWGQRPTLPAAVDPDDTKILLYTSGTTGDPKQVRHSHNTLAAALDNGVLGWALDEHDLMLMPSPVTHITGYVNGMEMPFFTATKSLLMNQWDVDLAIDLIETFGATACVSATPFLKELVDSCQAKGKHLPGFRLFACGGASVPPSLIQAAWDTLADCRAVRVYGSTEVPLVTVGYTAPEERSWPLRPTAGYSTTTYVSLTTRTSTWNPGKRVKSWLVARHDAGLW